MTKRVRVSARGGVGALAMMLGALLGSSLSACEPSPNACGGEAELSTTPGETCGACGVVVCEGSDATRCEGDTTNACGGCQALSVEPGTACGACGVVVCEGSDVTRCEERAQNACGGCRDLEESPGLACGVCGELVCAGPDALDCVGDTPNACGGCVTLTQEPGGACGSCGAGTYSCVNDSEVTCMGDTENVCGGCGALAAEPGSPCGGCDSGTYACAGPDEVTCAAPGCPLGARCAEDDSCQSGTCRGGRCVLEGWVFVPAGTFTMGAPLGEPGRLTVRENGQHEVTLTRSLLVAATTVTQGEWFATIGNRPSYFASCGDGCPVERVAWYEMLQYANARSRAEGLEECYVLEGCVGTLGAGCGAAANCTGYGCVPPAPPNLDCTGYRLPTESEWEYFARAGTTTAFITASGTITRWAAEPVDPALAAIAWYGGNSEVAYAGGFDCTSFRTTATHCGPHPVGLRAPNAWGLYDITGNVWEWTWDWLGTYPEPGTHVVDPTGPGTGTQRAMRGGPFNAWGQYMRVAYRSGPAPVARFYNIGFRLVRTLPGVE